MLPYFSFFILYRLTSFFFFKSLEEYLADFLDEMENLLNNGIEFKGSIIIVKIRSLICDAPARSFLKKIIAHNGSKGCERCTVEGTSFWRRMIFEDVERPKRTNQSFRSQADEKHHDGVTPLLRLGIDCVSQFVLDPMHLLYLGVMRKLLRFSTTAYF